MDQEEGPPAGRGRGRLRLFLAGAVVVVLGVAARGVGQPAPTAGALRVGVAPLSSPSSSEGLPSPTPPAARPREPALAEQAGRWVQLPQPPVRGGSPSAVWSGTELLVWGGGSAAGSPASDDGAVYDPRTEQWRAMPQAPLSARAEQVAVWADDLLVVWGGRGDGLALADGALYDPVADRWDALPPAPLSARAGAASAASGHHVVIVGGYEASGGVLPDGAVLDLGTRTWQRLPALPGPGPPPERLLAATDSDGVLIWSPEPAAVRLVARCTLPCERWQALVAPPGTGDLLLLLTSRPGGLRAVTVAQDGGATRVVTSARGRWQRSVEVGGERTFAAPPLTVESPGHLFVLWPESRAGRAYDTGSGRWFAVPAPRFPLTNGSAFFVSPATTFRTAVWAGAELLVVGGAGSADSALNLSAWRPAAP